MKPAQSKRVLRMEAISSRNAFGISSSASTTKTHSFCHGRLASDQLYFRGPLPSHRNGMTRAPMLRAISVVRSVLRESTTKISPAHATLRRHLAILASSFLVGIRTETGNGDAQRCAAVVIAAVIDEMRPMSG